MPKEWPPKLPRDFPLTVNARGYIKRIGGKVRWICGKLPPDKALDVYHRKAIALAKGQKPLAVRAAAAPVTTVHSLLARYIADREGDLHRGTLRAGAFDQQRRSCKKIDAVIGELRCDQINPDVVRQLSDRITESHTADVARRVVSHFGTACRHAADQEWVPPIRLGKIGKLTSRPTTTAPKWRLYTAEHIALILAEIGRREAAWGGKLPGRTWLQMRAGVLLALNGGMGSMECSELTAGVVDLDRAVVDHSRGKTGKDHLVPLWPETVDALRPVLALRRTADDLVFLTRGGKPWCYAIAKTEGRKVRMVSEDNFRAQFNEVVTAVGLKRPDESFYKLKHTAATVADEAGDPHATFRLFGHQLPGAKSFYVKVSEERLRAVVEHMRAVLLSRPTGPRPGGKAGRPPAAGPPASPPAKRGRRIS